MSTHVAAARRSLLGLRARLVALLTARSAAPEVQAPSAAAPGRQSVDLAAIIAADAPPDRYMITRRWGPALGA